MAPTFDQILQYLRPGAVYSNLDGTLPNVKWDPSVSAPSQQDLAAAVSAMAIPTEVTPLQMRAALRQMNLLDQVNTFVGAQTPAVQDAWEYADTMPITNPMVSAVAAALSVNLGALFTLAGSQTFTAPVAMAALSAQATPPTA
jgi:hypothetical protein